MVLIPFLGACSLLGDGRKAAVPTEQQVVDLLAQVYANRGNDDAICQTAATVSNCRWLLSGAPKAPATPPQVLCSRVYDGTKNLRAGLVVRVVGLSDTGEPYQSDLMAIRDGGEARLMNPVYWVPAKVNVSDSSDDAFDVGC